MTDSYDLVPGILPITITKDEPWSMSFTVSRNLAGFAHSAAVVLPGAEVPMAATCTPGTPTSLVNLSLTDEQVTALSLGIDRWYYRWVDPATGERTILKGPAKIARRS